jgi:hypothetical protein
LLADTVMSLADGDHPGAALSAFTCAKAGVERRERISHDRAQGERITGSAFKCTQAVLGQPHLRRSHRDLKTGLRIIRKRKGRGENRLFAFLASRTKLDA